MFVLQHSTTYTTIVPIFPCVFVVMEKITMPFLLLHLFLFLTYSLLWNIHLIDVKNHRWQHYFIHFFFIINVLACDLMTYFDKLCIYALWIGLNLTRSVNNILGFAFPSSVDCWYSVSLTLVSTEFTYSTHIHPHCYFHVCRSKWMKSIWCFKTHTHMMVGRQNSGN